jgi:hypothetical protein
VDERIELAFAKSFLELAVWGPGFDRVEVDNGSFKASNRRRGTGPLNANAESTTDDVDERIDLAFAKSPRFCGRNWRFGGQVLTELKLRMAPLR